MKMNSRELDSAKIIVDLALHEDVGTGDITTDNLIPAETRKKAKMVAKADGVIAGLQIAELVFRKLDSKLEWNALVADGSFVAKGDTIVEFTAEFRALLTGERTALNFLQRLSGIATASFNYASAVKNFPTKILDTRKTLPGYRLLDKYAVKAGGAANHRIGLFDMVMIKDNHIAVAGGIMKAIASIRPVIKKGVLIEIETTTLDEVNQAIEAGADIIMLDNMDNATMKKAVSLIAGRAKTEASGNMTIERLVDVAYTGVDFISVGALTHSVQALDISQKIVD